MIASIGFVVIADGDTRTPSYATFLSSEDEGKIAGELGAAYVSPPEEVLIASHVINVEDSEHRGPLGGCGPQLASALKALRAIGDITDEPHVLDLLAYIFFEGFKTGMAYQESRLRAELGIAAPSV